MSVVTKQLSSGDDWSIDENPDVLTRIYDSAVSIAVWQRQVQQDAQRYLAELLQKQTTISLKLSGSPEQLMKEIQKAFPQGLGDGQRSTADAAAFYADAHQVLEMFACLFDATTLGLRINTLDHAMCPRFHTDNVAVRLITTYHGLGTEWLPGATANRSALGTAMSAQVNTPGAIISSEAFIQRMSTGDVALLKGELWEGNEGRGIIHRSPALTPAQPRRLVMTCDLIH